MDNGNLRVMQSFGQPRSTTNPYIHMLDDALSSTPGIEHLRFSWRTALFGRYDALHFHWPETLIGARTPLRRAVKRARLQALLWRLRLNKTGVVRTIHNLELPSGLGRWDRDMLTHIREHAHVGIALNEVTSVPGRVKVIPHGHYVGWFAGMERPDPVPGRIAFVGLVRRYKGVESLIEAYGQLRARRDDVSLSISGSPTTEETAADIRARAGGVSDVAVHLEYLSEQAYARAISESSLVALPYVHMHNSGSVLAALSLNRPVLVPDNDVNRALAAEVGAGWIHTFEGNLTPDDIERALRSAIPRIPPQLDEREWAATGAAHLAAYREAVRVARGTV